MKNLNNCSFAGYIAGDFNEVKDGIKFIVLVNTGGDNDNPDLVTCVAFGKIAERIKKCTKKGTFIIFDCVFKCKIIDGKYMHNFVIRSFSV